MHLSRLESTSLEPESCRKRFESNDDGPYFPPWRIPGSSKCATWRLGIGGGSSTLTACFLRRTIGVGTGEPGSELLC
jgi:hypothetical protein